MQCVKQLLTAILLVFLVTIIGEWAYAYTDAPKATAPSALFFEMVRESDRDAARQFYKKYIDVKGMPVVASSVVADAALVRTYDIVTHLLAGRADILAAMVKDKMYLI